MSAAQQSGCRRKFLVAIRNVESQFDRRFGVEADVHSMRLGVSPARRMSTGLSEPMAFMFETRYPQQLTKYAAELETLQEDYLQCWDGLQRKFDGTPDIR